MNSNFLHNFFEGITSKYLKEKVKLNFETFKNVPINKLQSISANDIEVVNGRAIMKSQEDYFLMFAYLDKYNTRKWKKPKFHTRDCRTIKEYTHAHFVYSNHMPVNFYSTSERKQLTNQYLKLCGNCKNEAFRGLFSSEKKWYDEVLDYVENLTNPIKRKDGYITFWKQTSEAYRTKMNWKCENCSLNLKENKVYLHTHHKDGNKLNNSKNNFESLCILCHAFQHINKVKRAEGFLELNEFIEKFKPNLKQCKNPHLQEWEEMKKEQILILKK